MAPLFRGSGYEHWLIVLDKPGGEGSNKQQMINCYIETLAKVVGSSIVIIKGSASQACVPAKSCCATRRIVGRDSGTELVQAKATLITTATSLATWPVGGESCWSKTFFRRKSCSCCLLDEFTPLWPEHLSIQSPKRVYLSM